MGSEETSFREYPLVYRASNDRRFGPFTLSGAFSVVGRPFGLSLTMAKRGRRGVGTDQKLMTWLTLLPWQHLGRLGSVGSTDLTEPRRSGVDVPDGDPVGGVYWFLTRLVPGWSAFLYPAKMMTFARGLALLADRLGSIHRAGHGSNRPRSSPPFGLSVAGFAVCFSTRRDLRRVSRDFVSVRTLRPALDRRAKTSAAMALPDRRLDPSAFRFPF